MTSANLQPQVSRTQAWLLAIRPKTLPAAVGPVLVGTGPVVGDGTFRLRHSAALIAVVAIIDMMPPLEANYGKLLDARPTVDGSGYEVY